MVKHGSLTRAGKVKNTTPRVETAEKPKAKTGRNKKRAQFNRKFAGHPVPAL
jgi:ribosomal protein S30